MIYEKVKNKIEEKGFTIAFAESMTGGLATYRLTEIPGASNVLKGSMITYSIESKVKQLGISQKVIETYKVVSSEVALEMAKKVREKLETNIGVGITGDAGPTIQDDKEMRIAYYAICINHTCKIEHIIFDKETRNEAQEKAVVAIYETLDKLLS